MSAKPAALSLSDALGLGRLAMDAADGLTGLSSICTCPSSRRRDSPRWVSA